MSYAAQRVHTDCYDADSHIMERPDFIRDYLTHADRERIQPISLETGTNASEAWEAAMQSQGLPSAEVTAQRALGDGLISGPKGYAALGAYNREERSYALDQLGFKRQLVFATFSPGHVLHNPDVEAAYIAAAGHNRAMIDFCAKDERLMGVGMLPMEDPEQAAACVEQIVSGNLAAAWIAHRACGGSSPGHNDYDGIWARLAEANIPFVLHVGGDPLQLPPEWMNTGREVPRDWQGGGENVRGKDMIALHHAAETYLGAMIFDGVFERHRNLRGAAVELGAGWVPSWVRRLDWAASIWKREAELAALTRSPGEIVREHLGFTPYVYEDVGQLIRESTDDLYLFSSDYPHNEGSKNPIERFEGFLEGHSQASKDRFYAENFQRVFGTA